MFAEEIRRAIPATSRVKLADLSATLWKAFGAGMVSEDEAQALAEAIEARKAIPPAPTQPRRVGSRPRSSTSIERRRQWAGSGWMPPAITARFTTGEAAALAVILSEVALRGRCELPVGGVAGRAGVCATIVRRALRQARALGLVAVEERRLTYARNLPNIITVTSAELVSWLATRSRRLREGGGCKIVLTPKQSSILSSASTAEADRKAGDRGRDRPYPTRHLQRPCLG